MSVYIKGMEMPNNCTVCHFLFESRTTRQAFCTADDSKWIDLSETPCCKRHPNCPLIPVPDHGDLIDRQEFLKKHFGNGYMHKVLTADRAELEQAMVNMPLVISNAPTIIPADKEAEHG